MKTSNKSRSSKIVGIERMRTEQCQLFVVETDMTKSLKDLDRNKYGKHFEPYECRASDKKGQQG